MKLASVSFHHLPEQIGGAHIPAVAFKEWCDELGVECDLVCYKQGQSFEGYDGVFFCTPPALDAIVNIDVPFIVMIHAEFDQFDWRVMNMAKAVVVIDQEDKYWDFNNSIYWHPCCRPSHLLKGDEVFDVQREGVLYAARLSTWKNAAMLVAISEQAGFRYFGGVTIFGKANNDEYGKFVRSQKHDNVKFVDGIYTHEQLIPHYKSNLMFWDVSGTHDYKIEIKRLNLAAFEAMKYGCIPIVDPRTVPDVINEFAIDYRNLLDVSSHYYSHRRTKMLNLAKTSYFGYEAVKKQVNKIIGEFK